MRDLLILEDYPGFNLPIADWAHQKGIKTFYYVSPKIWAWNYRRIKRIRRAVDHMAVLFPFEVNIYQKENIPVTYVGHPMLQQVKVSKPAQALCEKWNCDKKHPIIGLLPGSRIQEIQLILPILIKTKTRLKQQYPNAQFLLALAHSLKKEIVQPYLDDDIHLIEGDTYNMVSLCDVVLCASGTATLEVALLQKPLVIVYRVNWLTAFIGRMVVRINHIGLCNIVAETEVAKEFIQEAATPENITQETMALLNDQEYRKQVLQKLQRLRALMLEQAPAMSVDQAVEQSLNCR